MARRFPSLSALRAFEAVARNLSFRKAADELSVTHSAISHQVKTLEEQLGVALLIRTSRSVELTEEGAFLFPILRDSFDRIGEGIRFLTSTGEADVLNVQVYVTVAMRWLIPRLHDFQIREPKLQIRLNTSYLDWEFDRQHADVAFLYVRKKQPDLMYVPLFRGKLSPVCSPALLEGEHGLKEPADLVHHNLLQVYTAPDEWQAWLLAAGMAELNRKQGITFDSYILAIKAAVEGQGVALVNGPFAAEDIKAGRLVRPFDLQISFPGGWYLVYRKELKNDRRVKRFSAWLQDQVAEDPEMACDPFD